MCGLLQALLPDKPPQCWHPVDEGWQDTNAAAAHNRSNNLSDRSK